MDIIEEIKKLKELLDQGAINEDEFQKLKSNLLSNNNQQSAVGSPASKTITNSKLKKGKGLRRFIITLLVFAFLFLIVEYLRKNDKINLNILPKHESNINSNNIDSLKIFDNIIYDEGVVVGKLVIVEFVKKSNKAGRVINVPEDKMWTPLFFEYEDLGNNYSVSHPQILTERNENQRVGRDYYYMNIYDDESTNIWWEKGSGFYYPEEKNFKSIKLSMRNKDAISGRNAIYVDGYEKDVKYVFHFFEEPIR